MDERFVFGTQYYRAPNPPRADWSRDLARIRANGMNTVKFWASWSWMHRGHGEIAFDELDELMELAAANELIVVINTILENAPYWLEREAPETRYVANDGQAVQLTAAINTPAGGWPGLCFDNPNARTAAGEFLQAVVGRYRHHPALGVWDVWNEPHIEPTWFYPGKLFCYCAASQLEFRKWLERRYPSLDALNSGWSRRYRSWEEVLPPRTHETYPDLLDWRQFWLDNLRSWLSWKADLVRALDPQHPVMTHVASSAYLGTLTSNGWDEWTLSEPVDLFGTSSFPLWLMDNDPVVHLFHLEMTRDAAAGKQWWQAELQGGRGRREGTASTRHPVGEEIGLWIWTALAAGAHGLLFWQWRPELLGPESPGYGLCTPSGDETARTRAAAAIAEHLSHFPQLGGSQPEPAEQAILVSRMTPLLAHASEGTMAIYSEALLGAYRAFIDNGVPIRFIHEDTLEKDGVPIDVRRLYWPLPAFASAATANALRRFVETGGHLTAEASPATYIEHGWHTAAAPAHDLDKLFGATLQESDVVDAVTIPREGTDIRGAWIADRLRVTTGTVAGTFADGSPAIVHHTFGSGSTTLIATLPSLAYERTRDTATAAWMTGLPEPRHPPNLLIRRRRANDIDFVIAVNWSSEHCRAIIDGELLRPAAGFESTPDGVTVDLPARTGAIAALVGEVITART